MHRYKIIIFWSNEDQAFIADVPELPGCKSHGDTPAEAFANAQKAMTLWPDTAQEFADPFRNPTASGLCTHETHTIAPPTVRNALQPGALDEVGCRTTHDNKSLIAPASSQINNPLRREKHPTR